MDNLYTADLIMEQYDYHGTYYVRASSTPILASGTLTVATAGYNYIALNDDVYVYTGVTSINSDQSNLGFCCATSAPRRPISTPRPVPPEYAAMSSAQGVVQDLGYTATFPLLNIADEPTYFIPPP